MTGQASHSRFQHDTADRDDLPRCLTAIQPYIPGQALRHRKVPARQRATPMRPTSPTAVADLCEQISAVASADEAIRLVISDVPLLIDARQVWVHLHASAMPEQQAPGATHDQPNDAVQLPQPYRLWLINGRKSTAHTASVELAIRSGHQTLGTLSVVPEGGRDALTADELTTLRLIALTLGQTLAAHRLREALSDHHLQSNASDAGNQHANVQHWNMFLAHVAHEVRTPLTCIKGHAQLLGRQVHAARSEKTGRLTRDGAAIVLDACERHLGPLEYQVKRIERLIHDMIDLARTAQGRLDLRLERHNLVTIVEQAIAATDLPASQSIMLDAPAEAWLRCDGARIEQALYDIVQHVLRVWSQEGAIHIAVRELTQGEAHQTVTIIGDEATEATLAVWRCGAQSYPPLSGPECVHSPLDLGLALSAAIAQHHEGQLYQIANRHGGSNFLFVLPLDGPTDTRAR